MRRHVVPLLAVVCVALAIALAALWIDRGGDWRHVRWTPPAPRVPDFAAMLPAVPVPATPDASQFAETRARPVFSPNRRPPVPKPPAATPVAPAAPPPPPPPDALAKVQVLGMYEGAKGGAIIARVDGKARRFGLSDTIGDWTLSSIDGREVTFSRRGESRVLSLAPTRPGATTPTPPAPAVAAPAPPPAEAAAGCNPRDAQCNPRDARR